MCKPTSMQHCASFGPPRRNENQVDSASGISLRCNSSPYCSKRVVTQIENTVTLPENNDFQLSLE